MHKKLRRMSVLIIIATGMLSTAVSTNGVQGGKRLTTRVGDIAFRQFYSGAPPTGTPALNGVFAGYAVAIEPADPN